MELRLRSLRKFLPVTNLNLPVKNIIRFCFMRYRRIQSHQIRAICTSHRLVRRKCVSARYLFHIILYIVRISIPSLSSSVLTCNLMNSSINNLVHCWLVSIQFNTSVYFRIILGPASDVLTVAESSLCRSNPSKHK
jgi:hypothetical protein